MPESPEEISHLVPSLWNEQRIPRARIEGTRSLEVRYVDIGSEQVDRGSGRPVNVHDAGNGSTARPLTGQLRLRLRTEPLVHIQPHVVGHEDLIRPLTLAEHFLPATLRLVTILAPDLLHFGQ